MLSNLCPKSCVILQRPQVVTGRSLSSKQANPRSVSFAVAPVSILSQKAQVQRVRSIPSHAQAKPRRQITCAASSSSSNPPAKVTSASISEPARKNLTNAAAACRRFGWLSFWTQLVLSVVSAIILLFSVAFTSMNGPSISLWLTLFGVVAGFLSTFWSFGYTRLSRRLYRYLSTGPDDESKRVKKTDVLNTLMRGSWINVLGLGSTLLGLQATVGLLVAKTLTNATANPFLAGGAGSYNPVLALDVFLVQASTNTLLSHFASLVLSLWLIRIVGRNPTASGSLTAAKT
ncbi:hypothetical protein ABBQ32_004235 [Trebouxia sp. C0010 RCD-2024]